MIFSDLYHTLSTPEKNGRIGLFRTFCAIFGGLLAAYSGMTLLVFLIPAKVNHAVIVPFLLTPLVWSGTALWISVSPTRLSALGRCFLPSLLFAVGILYFTLGGPP